MKLGIQASKLLKTPIYLGDTSFKRKIFRLVFNPSELKLFAMGYKENSIEYYVKTSSLYLSSYGVSAKISEVVKKEEDIALEEFLSQDCPIIGQKVKNEDGIFLGKVNDLVLDLDTFYILNLGIKGKNDLFIHRSMVKSVSSEYIVVKSTKQKRKAKNIDFSFGVSSQAT